MNNCAVESVESCITLAMGLKATGSSYSSKHNIFKAGFMGGPRGPRPPLLSGDFLSFVNVSVGTSSFVA